MPHALHLVLEPIAERSENGHHCPLYGVDNYRQGRNGTALNDEWGAHHRNRSWRRTDHGTATQASWKAWHEVERFVADWLSTSVHGRALVEDATPVYRQRQRIDAERAVTEAETVLGVARARLAGLDGEATLSGGGVGA